MEDAVFTEGLCCPITLDLMLDPVVDPEGNSYERNAILAHLAHSSESPLTRNPLAATDLVPNRALRSAIEAKKEALAVSAAQNSLPYEDLRVYEAIGTGTFGTVYRGKWQGHTTVAVKVARKVGDDIGPELHVLARLGRHLRLPNPNPCAR